MLQYEPSPSLSARSLVDSPVQSCAHRTVAEETIGRICRSQWKGKGMACSGPSAGPDGSLTMARQATESRKEHGGHWTRTATEANRDGDSNGKDRRRTEFAVGETKVAECTRRTRLHTLTDRGRGPQWRTVVKPWQRDWKRKVARSEVRTRLWRGSLRAAHSRASLTN